MYSLGQICSLLMCVLALLKLSCSVVSSNSCTFQGSKSISDSYADFKGEYCQFEKSNLNLKDCV